MTGNFHRRMDKLDNRIEERSIVGTNDREPMSPKRIARIFNWVYTKGLQSTATDAEKEASRRVGEMFPALRR